MGLPAPTPREKQQGPTADTPQVPTVVVEVWGGGGWRVWGGAPLGPCAEKDKVGAQKAFRIRAADDSTLRAHGATHSYYLFPFLVLVPFFGSSGALEGGRGGAQPCMFT